MTTLAAAHLGPPHADKLAGNPAGSIYFPEIDALRAFSVLGVMLYHLNPALLPGGFVGVDVFFVISGYVVSASLWRDIDRPFASMLGNFYARRVLRIVPALVVCLFATAVATILFIPDSWLSWTVPKTGLFAFFGISNFVLYRADSYFSPPVEFNPFAHTWTLGIEEQFYLLLPGIAYLSARSRSRLRARPWRWLADGLLPLLVAISVVIFVLDGRGDQRSNFYLLPGRFWELGIGVLLFRLQARPVSRPSAAVEQGLLGAGVALIALAAVFADRNAFPFPWAVPAALGSLLVIASVTSRRANPARAFRLLRHPFLVAVGTISYSLYLWHWSVYTLFRWTVGLAGIVMPLTAFGLSIALALFSYAVVEKPFRHGKMIRAVPKFAVVAGGLAVVVVSWATVREGFAKRDSLSLTAAMRAHDEWYPSSWPGPVSSGECGTRSSYEYADGTELKTIHPFCLQLGKRARRIFVFGDSHAGVYRPLFMHLASEEKVEVFMYTYQGCPFANLMSPLVACEKFSAMALAEISKNAVRNDIVFLAALRVPRLYDMAGPLDTRDILAKQSSPESIEDRRLAYRQASEFIGALEKRGLHIVLEAPPPVFRAPPSQCVDWFNAANPLCSGGLSISRDEVQRYREPIMTSIAALSRAYPDMAVWDPFPILCPTKTCRALTDAGHPLFIDGDHMSGFASTVLYAPFVALLHNIDDGTGAGAAAIPALPGQ